VYYPNKLDPAGEASQNLTVNPTPVRRKRGGQKGNGNARKHGFYSGTLSPAQTCQLWNITNLEGVDPEIAFIRVKLQSSLQYDPGNRRVIREASRLLVKWYSRVSLRGPTCRAVAISLFKVLFLFDIGILGLVWHLNFGICNCADRVSPPAPRARKYKSILCRSPS
jgi:hypothetical protein